MVFNLRFLYITVLIIALPSCWQETPSITVVESNAITDVCQHIKPEEYNKNTLVVFDIDNTIAMHPTDLGSDQWISSLFSKTINQGLSIFDALPTYYHAQMHTWLIPGEPSAIPLIKKLQQSSVTVIALTARDYHILYRTLQQLNRIGIDFSQTSPNKPFRPYGTREPVLYESGIIFTGGHDKGDVLLYWLDQMNYIPTKIIFIDDKLKNIKSVERAAQKTNYPFVGIRYGYFDDRVKSLDMKKMEQAYNELLEKFPESKPIKLMTARTNP